LAYGYLTGTNALYQACYGGSGATVKVCGCCGGDRLRKVGEDVTQTLETTPRQWKVIETVREKFTCRDCEKITQPPAPFHVIPRG
jgi:transposase